MVAEPGFGELVRALLVDLGVDGSVYL